MQQINNGFDSKYYLDEDGNVYNSKTNTYLKLGKDYTYYLKTTDNKNKKISLKTLYKKVYNKNFCYDNVERIAKDEIFKIIDNTNELYAISNYGRVMSRQSINAFIMKTTRVKGYERIELKVDGKRILKFIHTLVIDTFVRASVSNGTMSSQRL